MEILDIAFNVLLPIFVVAGVGAAYYKSTGCDRETIGNLLFYIFVPFFVVDNLANLTLSTAALIEMLAFVSALSIIMTIIGYAVAGAMGLSPLARSAFVLGVVIMNSANYGIPVNEFAFGQEGLEIATVYYIGSSLVVNTLGVFIASSGSLSPVEAVRTMVTTPLFGATALGLVIGLGGIELPAAINRPLGIVSAGTIPLMLLLLGMQLASIRLSGDVRPILVGAGLKLVVAGGIGLLLTIPFGLEGTTRNVAIVQSSMPTAVFTVVLAEKYGTQATITTGMILVSTLASMITLTVILSLLG